MLCNTAKTPISRIHIRYNRIVLCHRHHPSLRRNHPEPWNNCCIGNGDNRCRCRCPEYSTADPWCRRCARSSNRPGQNRIRKNKNGQIRTCLSNLKLRRNSLFKPKSGFSLCRCLVIDFKRSLLFAFYDIINVKILIIYIICVQHSVVKHSLQLSYVILFAIIAAIAGLIFIHRMLK